MPGQNLMWLSVLDLKSKQSLTVFGASFVCELSFPNITWIMGSFVETFHSMFQSAGKAHFFLD